MLSFLSAVAVANDYLPAQRQANRFIRFENVSAPDELVLHRAITNQSSSILFLWVFVCKPNSFLSSPSKLGLGIEEQQRMIKLSSKVT